MNLQRNPNLPHEAEVIANVRETSTIFTLHLRFTDPNIQEQYDFKPGQFNMLYLYGVGEVAISIVSDPIHKADYQHTIRAVGHVTKGLEKLKKGDRLGLRGPFGRGWPLEAAEHKNVVVITGGLGCAPVVSVINYILHRRDLYGNLKILQGIKHSDDFIFKKRYAEWRHHRNVEVYIAADVSGKAWPFHTGFITDFISTLEYDPEKTVVMMCGPEGMIHIAVRSLLTKGIPSVSIFLNMERNMKCALGHCGHCQYGGAFVCKDGPVFSLPEVERFFHVEGY